MTSNKVDGNQRLPTNVYPTHYDVAIKTDLASSPPMFLGEAVISLTSETEASEITFNVDPSLKITHLAIAAGSSGLTNFDVAAITVDEEWQTATVDLAPIGGIKAGEAKLFVRWEAELGGNMNGYYKSIGTADENGHRPMLVYYRSLGMSLKRPATLSPSLNRQRHAAHFHAGMSRA